MRQAVNQEMRVNILRGSVLLLLPALLFIRPQVPFDSFGHEALEVVGTLLLIAGVLGRLWAILYVGAVKNAEVVQDGPYSMTRNPLYVASTVAAVGIGLMLGAVTFAVLLGGVVGGILYMTARRESAFLADHFGSDYAAYAARVPFFFPDPRLFHTRDKVLFSARNLRTNLRDAMVFLAFIPLVELIDAFKTQYGWSGIAFW